MKRRAGDIGSNLAVRGGGGMNRREGLGGGMMKRDCLPETRPSEVVRA